MATTPKEKKAKPPGWIPAPMDVILNPKLTATAVRLYLYLLWRQGKNSDTWPSIDTICTDLFISVATARRSLESLRQQELLLIVGKRVGGRGFSNHYKVAVLANASRKRPPTPSGPDVGGSAKKNIDLQKRENRKKSERIRNVEQA